MINRHTLAKTLKKIIYPRGETYLFANNRLRFKVGSRPIRRKYLTSENDIDRNDVLQINYLENNFRSHHVLWDVGSHHGHYSIFAASVARSANQVFSFEPDSDARAVQRENIQLNNFKEKITLLDIAVSNSDGVREFSAQQGNANSHLLSGEHATNGAVTVETKTLNSLLQSLPRPSFVKIDTEGAEVDILTTAGDLLADASIHFICELHPFAWDYFNVNFDQLLAALAKHGRTITPIDPDKKVADLPFYGTVLF